jgi:hypothetical protein
LPRIGSGAKDSYPTNPATTAAGVAVVPELAEIVGD